MNLPYYPGCTLKANAENFEDSAIKVIEALRSINLRKRIGTLDPNKIETEDLQDIPPIALVGAFRKNDRIIMGSRFWVQGSVLKDYKRKNELKS